MFGKPNNSKSFGSSKLNGLNRILSGENLPLDGEGWIREGGMD
jgi:hypothetical protein